MAISDPTDITGCVVWLDPATNSGVGDGGAITTWADQSGQGNDATQATAGQKPTWHAGSNFHHNRSMVGFLGTNDRLNIATDASIENGQVTYVAVVDYQALSGAGSRYCWNKTNSSNPFTVAGRVNGGVFNAGCRLNGSEGTARQVSDTRPAEHGPVIIAFRYDGTDLKLQINGVVGNTLSISGAIDVDSGGNLTVGNHPSVDNAVEGYMGDFVVYDNAISDADLGDLEDWLRARYYYPIADRAALVSSTQIRTVSVWDDSPNSQYIMAAVPVAGTSITYYTAPYADPHNWTLVGNLLTGLSDVRGCCLLQESGGDWYLYYDDAVNGVINVATGASLGTLSVYGSNPVLIGDGTGDETYVRHPYVIEESGAWTMLYDGRDTSPDSGVGALFRATSSDGLAWTRDTTNNPVIDTVALSYISADVTAPSFKKLGANSYLLAIGSFSGQAENAHQIGIFSSTDTITWTDVYGGAVSPFWRVSDDDFIQGDPELHILSDGAKWLYYQSENAAGNARQNRMLLEAALGGLSIPIAMYHRLRQMGV